MTHYLEIQMQKKINFDKDAGFIQQEKIKTFYNEDKLAHKTCPFSVRRGVFEVRIPALISKFTSKSQI